ncbi:hypothetical protein F4859DRAFT_524111 [Xylaria cf. heliscus]|nr:hypothetical protein F4859DRAFT_524111 [Xylaria cf. heliscus]
MSSPYNDPKTWGRGLHDESLRRIQADGSLPGDKYATWIRVQSKKIIAAFPRPSKPSRPIQYGQPLGSGQDEGSNDDTGFAIVRPWHRRPESLIWRFTTLADLESAHPIPGPSHSILEGQVDENLESGDEDGGNNSDQNEQKADGCSQNDDTIIIATDGTWHINPIGQLILPYPLASLPFSLDIGLFAPLTEQSQALELEQSAAVARLAAEDRQLEALRLALQFAIAAVLGCTNEFSIVATVQILEVEPPFYPAISLFISEWQEDAQLARYFAYHVLRETLKRYRHLPFPDRLNIWEYLCEDYRLLVPYGELAEGETARVRARIVQELEIEGPFADKESMLQEFLVQDNHEGTFAKTKSDVSNNYLA